MTGFSGFWIGRLNVEEVDSVAGSEIDDGR
jgi:hypothetical protein